LTLRVFHRGVNDAFHAPFAAMQIYTSAKSEYLGALSVHVAAYFSYLAAPSRYITANEGNSSQCHSMSHLNSKTRKLNRAILRLLKNISRQNSAASRRCSAMSRQVILQWRIAAQYGGK
jgi:hypothetical protein